MTKSLSSALAVTLVSIVLAIAPATSLAGEALPPSSRLLITHVNIVPMAGSQPDSAIEQHSYEHWSRQLSDGRVKHDEFYLRATGIFRQEGVTLLAGTDAGIFTTVPGQSLLEELALLVRPGSAHSRPWADLILLDADPMRDIAATQTLSGLVVRGQWHDAAAIARLKQAAAATSAARTEQRVRAGLAAQGTSLDW